MISNIVIVYLVIINILSSKISMLLGVSLTLFHLSTNIYINTVLSIMNFSFAMQVFEIRITEVYSLNIGFHSINFSNADLY